MLGNIVVCSDNAFYNGKSDFISFFSIHFQFFIHFLLLWCKLHNDKNVLANRFLYILVFCSLGQHYVILIKKKFKFY